MSRASMLWLAAALVGLSGCERFGAAPASEAAQQAVRKAEVFNEQRDYQRAAESYEEALRSDAGLSDVHFKLAVIYDKKLDQFLPAIYHYEAFLRMDPESEKARLASEFLKNAQFQYIAHLPHFKGLTSTDQSRLVSDNQALQRQINDLKMELAHLRAGKSDRKSVSSPSAAPPKFSSPKASSSTSGKTTYRVQKGDGLQAIAFKVYGDRSRWRDILNANPSLKSPTDLKPGQVLMIP